MSPPDFRLGHSRDEAPQLELSGFVAAESVEFRSRESPRTAVDQYQLLILEHGRDAEIRCRAGDSVAAMHVDLVHDALDARNRAVELAHIARVVDL